MIDFLKLLYDCYHPVTRLPTVTHCETVSTHSATPERFEMIEPPVDDSSSLNDTEWTRVSEAGSGRGEPSGTEDPPPWPLQMPLPATDNTSSSNRSVYFIIYDVVILAFNIESDFNILISGMLSIKFSHF